VNNIILDIYEHRCKTDIRMCDSQKRKFTIQEDILLQLYQNQENA